MHTTPNTPPPFTPPRRTWLGAALVGLLTAHTAHAQMGGSRSGGMGGRGGSHEGTKCAAQAAEPVSSTLLKIYAGERLRSLPAELQLAPELLPLYERYAQAVQKILLQESTWAARPSPPDTSAISRIGAQIDLASNRAALWEDVLDAVKPLYARLDKNQQAIADKRLVVSLEPQAWALPPRPSEGAPAGSPPPTMPR